MHCQTLLCNIVPLEAPMRVGTVFCFIRGVSVVLMALGVIEVGVFVLQCFRVDVNACFLFVMNRLFKTSNVREP